MTEKSQGQPHDSLPGPEELEASYSQYQRLLALTDEILALRVALAQESVRSNPSRERLERAEAEMQAMKADLHAVRRSATWRVGRFVLLPVRVIKWLARGLPNG